MKVLSLFDGISCARVACDRAGIQVENYYASEIDKYAISISQKNYPDIKQVGSVVDIKSEDYKDIDLLIGGSPCQDLSIAKKNRQGLEGSRSGLFYEYLRILKEVKPKYFILENVNSMPKEAKETITKELFGIEPIMINAALVSAQNRKRLFWVGKLVGDTYEQVKIELPEDRGVLLRDILEDVVEKYFIKDTHNYERKSYGAKGKILKDETKSPTLQAAMGTGGGNNILIVDKDKSNTIRTSGRGSGVDESFYVKGVEVTKQGKVIGKELDKSHSLMARDYKGFGNQAMTGVNTIRIGQFNSGGQADIIYSQEGKSVALSANGGGRGAKTGLYEVTEGSSFDYYNNKEVPNGKAKVLGTNPQCQTAVAGQLIKQNSQIRKLTPIECERLQSLPDNYTEGVSNTQRYKACGNAFNVEVVAHILKQLV